MKPDRKPGPGRPKTGETPKRNIRVGDVWDEAAAIAEAHGETMTDLVKRLLDNYVRRHRRNVPQPRPPADYVPYGDRKPYAVADRLEDLRGPTSGTVTLPKRLDWSGTPVYDLDDPARLTTMYKVVLSEAATVEDLNTWLNRDKLIELWPALTLPRRVRALWQDRFPQLAEIAEVA